MNIFVQRSTVRNTNRKLIPSIRSDPSNLPLQHTNIQIPYYLLIIPVYCVLKIVILLWLRLGVPDGSVQRIRFWNTLRLLRDLSRQQTLFIKGWNWMNNVWLRMMNATSDVIDAGTFTYLEGPLCSSMPFSNCKDSESSKFMIDLKSRKSKSLV